jgi:hypothetical protein
LWFDAVVVGFPFFFFFFLNSNFFLEKVFFGLKKLIKIFEKVFPNLHLETHLVPVGCHSPIYSW